MDILAQYYFAELKSSPKFRKQAAEFNRVSPTGKSEALASLHDRGYQHLPDQNLLLHSATGVVLWGKPLFVSSCRYAHPQDLKVLYHYTYKQAFDTIISEGSIFASTRLATDCDFGVGQYATQKPPHLFNTAMEILINNYPRATSQFERSHPDFPSEDRVAFCVPLVVILDWTPAFPLTDPDGSRGAVTETSDRHGPFDASQHDIWVVCSKRSENIDFACQRSVSLFKAVEQNQVNIVTELLAGDACLLHSENRGNTVLHLASEKGYVDVVRELLAHKADVNKPSKQWNCTPLMLSVRRDCLVPCLDAVQVTSVLLSARANPDALDNDGYTPLMVAARKFRAETVSTLLQAKACVNIGSRRGPALLQAIDGFNAGRSRCPELICSELGSFEEIVVSLLSHRASVDVADETARTPALVMRVSGFGHLLDASGQPAWMSTSCG